MAGKGMLEGPRALGGRERNVTGAQGPWWPGRECYNVQCRRLGVVGVHSDAQSCCTCSYLMVFHSPFHSPVHFHVPFTILHSIPGASLKREDPGNIHSASSLLIGHSTLLQRARRTRGSLYPPPPPPPPPPLCLLPPCTTSTRIILYLL